jgi:hypothetical protein
MNELDRPLVLTDEQIFNLQKREYETKQKLLKVSITVLSDSLKFNF